MKIKSCKSCALNVSLPQTTIDDAVRVEEIYAEFRRRNRKSNRIIDVGGSDDKTTFCALGSRHFKKHGVRCRQWVPDIGIGLSDAIAISLNTIAINLNRKMFWLTLLITILTSLSVAPAVMQLRNLFQQEHPGIEVVGQNVPQSRDEQRQASPSKKQEKGKQKANAIIENPALKNSIIKQ